MFLTCGIANVHCTLLFYYSCSFSLFLRMYMYVVMWYYIIKYITIKKIFLRDYENLKSCAYGDHVSFTYTVPFATKLHRLNFLSRSAIPKTPNFIQYSPFSIEKIQVIFDRRKGRERELGVFYSACFLIR